PAVAHLVGAPARPAAPAPAVPGDRRSRPPPRLHRPAPLSPVLGRTGGPAAPPPGRPRRGVQPPPPDARPAARTGRRGRGAPVFGNRLASKRVPVRRPPGGRRTLRPVPPSPVASARRPAAADAGGFGPPEPAALGSGQPRSPGAGAGAPGRTGGADGLGAAVGGPVQPRHRARGAADRGSAPAAAGSPRAAGGQRGAR